MQPEKSISKAGQSVHLQCGVFQVKSSDIKTTPLWEMISVPVLWKGWGQIAKLLQIKIYLSDLGITWHSCSGMYPEAIAQVIPKSVCGSCSNPHGTTLEGDKITRKHQKIISGKMDIFNLCSSVIKTKREGYFRNTFGGTKWAPDTQKGVKSYCWPF